MEIQTKRKIVEIVDLMSLPCAFFGLFEVWLQYGNPELSLHFWIYATVGVVVACFLTLYFYGKYQIQGILMDFGFSPKEAEGFQTKNKNYDIWPTLHFVQKEKMDNISARKYIQEKLIL